MAVGTSVAAGATNSSLFSGQTYERAPFDCLMDLYSTGSAIGLNMELVVGGRLAVSNQPVNANNRVPIVPDDLAVSSIPVRFGELIQLRSVNPTAGALTHNARAELTQAVFG